MSEARLPLDLCIDCPVPINRARGEIVYINEEFAAVKPSVSRHLGVGRNAKDWFIENEAGEEVGAIITPGVDKERVTAAFSDCARPQKHRIAGVIPVKSCVALDTLDNNRKK